MKALQGVGHSPTVSLPRFPGRPESPGGRTIDGGKASGGFGGLAWWVCEAGCVLFHPVEVRRDVGALVSLLRRVFVPLGDRDVAIRCVLFADAVGGRDSC